LPIAKPAPAWADAPRRRTEGGHVGRSKPKKSLELKGIAVALADGISSSDVSHIASQAGVIQLILASRS